MSTVIVSLVTNCLVVTSRAYKIIFFINFMILTVVSMNDFSLFGIFLSAVKKCFTMWFGQVSRDDRKRVPGNLPMATAI